MDIPFQIIASSSAGNAVVVNKFVLIDCGVSYKAIEPYVKDLKLVLLTHEHGDHFKPKTIKRIYDERPTIRFGCCRWLVSKVSQAGIPVKNIDVLKPGTMSGYGLVNVTPVLLYHDVPNCGYKLFFKEGKVFYATDTSNLRGIHAPKYDLYLVEANYTEADIKSRMDAKKENGEFIYEKRVILNHLSKEACDDFVYKNIGQNGTFVYLHQHVDKPRKTDES